jgi:RinA family phage transcriptional activator
MSIDDQGARSLMASILKQAFEDYTKSKACPDWCQFRNECQTVNTDKQFCDAKQFLHSAWCATLCDGVNIDHQEYVRTCIDKHRLNKNTYRYVEHELRDYLKTKKELENMKNDITSDSPISQEIRGTNKGDTTANKAIKLSCDKKIIEMEKKTNAVEKVYKKLTVQQRAVMEEFWRNRFTNNGLALEIGVNEKTIRRWKRIIVYSVAVELNYL